MPKILSLRLYQCLKWETLFHIWILSELPFTRRRYSYIYDDDQNKLEMRVNTSQGVGYHLSVCGVRVALDKGLSIRVYRYERFNMYKILHNNA